MHLPEFKRRVQVCNSGMCAVQVLDDNVFDQRMRSHQSAEPDAMQSGASSMDIDGQAAAVQGRQQDSWTM